MLHQSAFLLALRNASPGTECASPTSVPHFLVDRPFAVVWLYFSWLPRWRDSFRALGGSLFGVPSTDRGSRLRDMSNFCCLPGRAGGTPLLVSPGGTKSQLMFGFKRKVVIHRDEAAKIFMEHCRQE